MKAVDTNLLVRILVGDDPRQSAKARTLLEEAEKEGQSFLVVTPVVVELIWVLESSYDCTRTEVIDALEELARMPVLQFEGRDRIRNLVALCRSTNLDPADALIGLTASDLGCETTLTYDKRAAKSPLFTAVL